MLDSSGPLLPRIKDYLCQPLLQVLMAKGLSPGPCCIFHAHTFPSHWSECSWAGSLVGVYQGGQQNRNDRATRWKVSGLRHSGASILALLILNCVIWVLFQQWSLMLMNVPMRCVLMSLSSGIAPFLPKGICQSGHLASDHCSGDFPHTWSYLCPGAYFVVYSDHLFM